ncbi:STAS/SEC14 domain-containing protein [Phenylobacterium sp.]|uniref:STAS/SEC14 domain-containing protein n=1 Tax=Phenylobacterium sp. TaxID=1871053 RepID=UPI00301C329C
MIELLESPDHVFACRIEGVVDGADYDRAIQAVEARLAAHPRIGLYADMTGFSSMTAEAFMKDLRYNFEKLGQWSRFPRAAIVTDEPWLRASVRLLDPIFPQFEARAFAAGEEAAAMAWASDIPGVRS